MKITPWYEKGYKRLLADESDLVVCGEADNSRGVLSKIEEAAPDLVLLDISLPGADGLELIKNLKTQRPHLRIMVLSMHPEEVYAERVLRSGARGYLMKQASPEELLTAIRTVLRDRNLPQPAAFLPSPAIDRWKQERSQKTSSQG